MIGFNEAAAFCSAMFGNTAVVYATYPLDTIKTRQQTASSAVKSSYTRGLYKGVVPTVLVTSPCSGLYFASFEALQHYNRSHSLTGDLGCACAAQVIAGALLVPGDLLKINLQAGTYPSLSVAVRALRQTDWRSSMAAMRHSLMLSYLRDLSFVTLQMTIYVRLRRQGDTAAQIAGPVAAGTASLITAPLDTLRTRYLLTSDSGGKAAAMAEANYFAGAGPRVLLAAVTGLIFFRCYEWCRPLVMRTLLPSDSPPSCMALTPAE